ncbi:hypothetical protein BC828DRAFT_393379 [Blastocladiella britannica]|nr:hypothetical protein BC828DRAFT_393379 [Blastocladiella britannica]
MAARPLLLAPLLRTVRARSLAQPLTLCALAFGRQSFSTCHAVKFQQQQQYTPVLPTVVSHYDIGHQKCTGCGAKFQFDDPAEAGYVTDARIDTYRRAVTAVAATTAGNAHASPADLEAEVAKSVVDWKYLSKSQRKKRVRAAQDARQAATGAASRADAVAQLVCQRCHDITHTNTSGARGARVVRPDDLDFRKLHRALFVQVVDALDFPASHFSMHRIVPPHAPYLLVFNKVDLLPLSATPARLQQWAEHYARRLRLRHPPASVHVVSAKSGAGVREMMEAAQDLRARQGLRDIYMLGCTNAGKTELLNCLHRMVKFPKSAGKLTASRLHGTTVANLPIPLARFTGLLHGRPNAGGSTMSVHDDASKGSLIDTPGVTLPGRLSAMLTDPQDMRLVHATKRLAPVSYRVPPGKSVFLGGLARIDVLESSSPSRIGLTIWTSNLVPVHITSVAKAHVYCGTEPLSEHDILHIPSSAVGGMGAHEASRGSLAQAPPSISPEDEEDAPSLDPVTVAETSRAIELAPALDLEGGDTPPQVDDAPVVLDLNILNATSDPLDPLAHLPRMDPDRMPAILAPPSVTARASVPEWRPAGNFAVRTDGIHRSWADIVVGGVGWVSISGDADRTVLATYSPGGEGIALRDALMPFDFGYPMKKVE